MLKVVRQKSFDKESRPTLLDNRFLSDDIFGCQKSAVVGRFFSLHVSSTSVPYLYHTSSIMQ